MAPDLVENAVKSHNQIVRPVANFSPSLWGDQFLKYNSDSKVKEEYSKAIEALKNEAGSMLKLAYESNIVDALNLIDTLERLGVSHHFENEIEEKIGQLFGLGTNYEDESYDLHTVALHFRVFRQHGHHFSPDVFSKFMDGEKKFKDDLKSDVKGLLGLYEASHLRIRGEDILDYALSFAKSNLKPDVSQEISNKQLAHALVQPLHFGYPRVEARNFISFYEENETKIDTLLRFAKLDYNLLQMLHKEELQQVSRWWQESGLVSKLPYARDRVVECFFWAVGVYHEPQYSRARVMLTKSIIMNSVIDDTYDSYGTIEELDIFTEAIERWNISQLDTLPDYLKPLYEALFELYVEFEQELSKQGRSYGVYYAKEALKEIVRSYNVEAKWFIEGYLPPFSEYLDNALITCTYCYLTPSSLLGTKFAKEKDYKWLSEKPKMLVAGLKICRFIDDIATYEIEKERGQLATGIECYMNENGVSKKEAMAKFFEMAINAWKDTNEECLKPSARSRDVLMRVLNFSRMIYVTYKNNEDGYTHPEKVIKPHILALFVDPIKI